MRVDLDNRVALVTGAARNIGKAIADAFAANGARVVYADIDPAGAEQAAAAWPGCVAATMDVTRDDQVQAVLAGVARDLGGLDILVNNAGVNTLQHRVNIDEFPRAEWDRLLAVDLTGLYVVSQAGARLMRTRRGGRIINIASVVGLVPARLQCAFVAAKAGVVNLTRAMALELAPYGILTNAIAPGSILTDGTRQLFYGEDGKFRGQVQQMLAHIPLGRPGSPEEVAHAALFLAAPESSYINGHILTVDGGWTAGYLRDF
ncbi:MAG: SDR family oxidoreductase, partial [Planctomycetes bacterium]|nr:SDR family oxidoreductase [Planctomycetota bacterium]